MKTLAVFAESLYGGGVETVLQTLLRNFDTKEFFLTLYSIREESLDAKRYPESIKYRFIFESIDAKDTELISFLKKVKNKLMLFFYYHFSPEVFYSLFIKRHFDVAVAFIEGYATRIVSGAPSNTRKIAWVHTDMQKNHWTDVAFRNPEEETKCYDKFEQIVCVSQHVKEIMHLLFHVEGRTIVLANPIDRDKIIQDSREKLPGAYEKNDRLRIISIGSLTPVKGYDRLLRCIIALLQDGIELELFIIGKGPMRQELSEMIEANKLKRVVIMTGFLDNPYPILASADIYVCSSFAEGLNTAISEALILGIPVISTDCSGTEELLGESEYGLVVSNDEESLITGLRRLLADSRLRRKYSERAFERGMLFSLQSTLCFFNEMIRR